MDYNTDEQEIDLKDLMFAVFHKWRPVILVAVICGHSTLIIYTG